ncbi:hypothetical protein [Chromobacterium rhizoryzae]|uniref:hypothetical protein n=1 Tax=Chromobacterium rhizoryzae TaxID=1778675 RepID=UPI001D06A3CC|nr:hypothetical protein [Chromobacterium rhizoryzae]
MNVNDLISTLKNIREALNKLPNDKVSDQHGYNAPPIDRSDISYSFYVLIDLLESVDLSTVEDVDSQRDYIDDLTEKAKVLLSSHVPNLFSSPHSSVALMSFVFAAEHQIASLINSDQLKGVLVLPTNLRRHVLSAQDRLNKAVGEINEIKNKVLKINSAYDAALNLPTTMSDLEAAVADIASSKNEVEAKKGQIDSAVHAAEKSSLLIAEKESQASILMENLNAAYVAATSQSLASSFSKRAKSLSYSVWAWTIILTAALFVAGYVTFYRFPEMKVLIESDPTWRRVAISATLSFSQLAAPIWLAVVATKQIAFKFRLAEDYAYKASLAAAYQGYKHEANVLDPMLGAQLFSIALNRLDEIPLRLVEKDVHGTPLMELIKSQEFKDAVGVVPSLGERLHNILKRVGAEKKVPPVKSEKVDPVDTSS